MKELTYEQKPKADHTNKNNVFKLLPTNNYIELFTGIAKLASEREWTKGTLTTSFLDGILKNSRRVFDSDLASAFKAQLSPKQRARLETSFNVAGKIADTIASFQGQQSTSEAHVYKGNLTVMVHSHDQDYHVYKVKPMVFGNQILNEKYLIKAPGVAFTTKDLGMFGQNCTITPLKSKGSICNTQPTPSLEARKCAREILESKPLDTCGFVSVQSSIQSLLHSQSLIFRSM